MKEVMNDFVRENYDRGAAEAAIQEAELVVGKTQKVIRDAERAVRDAELIAILARLKDEERIDDMCKVCVDQNFRAKMLKDLFPNGVPGVPQVPALKC